MNEGINDNELGAFFLAPITDLDERGRWEAYAALHQLRDLAHGLATAKHGMGLVPEEMEEELAAGDRENHDGLRAVGAVLARLRNHVLNTIPPEEFGSTKWSLHDEEVPS